MLKRLFCWLYEQWLSKAVNEKSDPLVKLLDFLAGSECKYCMAVRCVMLGLGAGFVSSVFYHYLAGVAITLGVLGVVLSVLAILFTLGEKYWLCEVK
jgi:hypothetical protein